MFYNKTRDEVIEDLKSNEQYGLHANELDKIRGTCGYNELQEQKKQSLFVKFLLQFTDPLIIVLIAAAVVSILVDPHEWIDSLIIVIVVIFNAVLGVVQENNAEKSLDALKKMSAPNSKVVRDGERLTIPSRELVVGDVVILEAGDFIPSDGRILESYNLKVDESALTGESLPVNKISDVIGQENVPLGDQKNMVFASTVVTYGRGKMIVTSVGMNNEVGKIATMLMSSEKETTPLQNKLAQISKVIGIMCLGICAVVFGLEWMSGLSVLESFKTSVALAVAAIPEGLATVVTIVLAIGVTKMVKSNAIVRKLPAVETLGSASVVCSDKTGTLTQNKMTVVKTYTIDEGVQVFDGKGNESVRQMMKCFTLCSDAEIKFEGNEMKLFGDPTETALVEASFKMGDKKEDMHLKAKRSDEIAFDSDRKMMTVFFETEKGVVSLTKGAPDVIMSRCGNTPKDASEANEKMANQALRVLAVAYRIWDTVPVLLEASEVEKDMTFVGLVGMIDPPRPEVKVAIEEAKQGGIRTVMITGDHVTTAKAIAMDLGILEEGQKAITGTELSAMSEEELARNLEKISVYARVAPEHKVRIVSAWQAKGHVVAMTGDGVNDSPALKKADIGCAMGITGTDVSKGAADMILTDDNFATIIHAVKEGRGIYNNIKKDVQFLLSSNIGEVITIFTASVLSVFGYNLGVPLLPVHLLWVNLITDTLPAFALGLEPVDKDIMKQKPRPKNESFFSHGLGWTIAWQGIMVGSLTLTAYIIGNNITHEIGMTMAFMTLSLSQLFHAFNIKSSHSIFHRTIFNNKYLWGALAIGVILQVAVMYIPGVNTIFSLEPLNLPLSMISLGLALCPIVIVEIVKLFKNHIFKK